jgi:hypothetical protein
LDRRLVAEDGDAEESGEYEDGGEVLSEVALRFPIGLYSMRLLILILYWAKENA